MHHECIAEERKEGKLQNFGPSQAKNVELELKRQRLVVVNQREKISE